jgi:hypothetical protein
MDKIFYAEVVAGHEFDVVKARKAFANEHRARIWGKQKCDELLAKEMEIDPSFEYGYAFQTNIREVEFDERGV